MLTKALANSQHALYLRVSDDLKLTVEQLHLRAQETKTFINNPINTPQECIKRLYL